MPKRMLYTLVIVVVWLGLVIQGSLALLSDQASLTDNTITSATLDLVINTSQTNTPSSFAQSQRGFSYTLLPGQSDTKYIYLKNQSDGSVAMDLSVMPTVKGVIPQDALASIQLEFAPSDATGIAVGPYVSGTLSDLANGYVNLNAELSPGAVQRYIIKTTMLPAFSYSNQVVTYDLQFVGTQKLSS